MGFQIIVQLLPIRSLIDSLIKNFTTSFTICFFINENLISAKHFLILYTSNVDQQVRPLETVSCYCFKEMEYTFLNVMLKHMMGHLSEASGAASVTNKGQPLAEYTHYRNHVFNLAISYACKN